jgi:hypothetical protein
VSVSFPNHSRSYDATRRAVRFWGYESSMEWSFYMTEDALRQVRPGIEPDEAGFLSAFDANREKIYAAAARVHARGRKGHYDLLARDF